MNRNFTQQNKSLLETLKLQVHKCETLSLKDFLELYPDKNIYEVMSAARWLERKKYINIIDRSTIHKIDCTLCKSWRKGPIRFDGKFSTIEVFQEYWSELKQSL